MCLIQWLIQYVDFLDRVSVINISNNIENLGRCITCIQQFQCLAIRIANRDKIMKSIFRQLCTKPCEMFFRKVFDAKKSIKYGLLPVGKEAPFSSQAFYKVFNSGSRNYQFSLRITNNDFYMDWFINQFRSESGLVFLSSVNSFIRL